MDTSGINEAVIAAEKSDVVVLVAGGTSMTLSGIGWGKENPNDHATCGEGFDRADLVPPGIQPELIRTIHKTGKPIIFILVNGRAYDIRWENEHLPAILEAWYPGEQGGNAVAKILFGEVNPSGKLSVSFPQSVGHVPVYYNHQPSGRGFYHQPGSQRKTRKGLCISFSRSTIPFWFWFKLFPI